MIKQLRRVIRKCVTNRYEYKFWKNNDIISEFQPAAASAKVIIAALTPAGLKSRGKVNVVKFFPPFCQVLGQHGIGSAYIRNSADLQRELLSSREMPIILIDLVHELYDELESEKMIREYGSRIGVVFNSYKVAHVVRDKKIANDYLSSHGIPMPRCGGLDRQKIFSNVRIGTKEPVFVHDDIGDADKSRYNSEFIDTRIRIGDTSYYTSVRLMCIGSRLLQAYVRARDTRENNPSVHTADTPLDHELLQNLYRQLVATRIKDYSLLAKRMGSVLGPGFYAHDVLVDNTSHEIFVCETGFKFFDDPYWDRIKSIADGRDFQYNVVRQYVYAKYAAGEFLSYCKEQGVFRAQG